MFYGISPQNVRRSQLLKQEFVSKRPLCDVTSGMGAIYHQTKCTPLVELLTILILY